MLKLAPWQSVLAIYLIFLLIAVMAIYKFIPKHMPTMLLNFKTIQLPNTPNYFLACPVSYCHIEPDLETPVYSISITELAQRWAEVVAGQPRLTVLAADEENYQYTYRQTTRFLRFPDFINVKLIKINEQQSSLAIFSQSKYGYSDLGMNEKRVKSWLGLLNEI